MTEYNSELFIENNILPTDESRPVNLLPGREEDTAKLVAQHFQAFQIAQNNDSIMRLFEKLKTKHLNNYDIENTLYHKNINAKEFDLNFKRIIRPVYLSASNVGFADWNKRIYES